MLQKTKEGSTETANGAPRFSSHQEPHAGFLKLIAQRCAIQKAAEQTVEAMKDHGRDPLAPNYRQKSSERRPVEAHAGATFIFGSLLRTW